MITRAPRSSVGSSMLTLDLMETGLSHIDGAQQVIQYLVMKPRIKKLNLSRNEIGDYGSIALFEFLSSPRGRKIELAELNLNQNGIGMAGLRAISAYIRGNTTLQELNIQNNNLIGSADVISGFTSSVNKSHVSRLVLSGNTSMSDTFAKEFFTHLTSPHLRSLDISLIGLTPTSGPFIVSYLTSDRALRLREIACNGNALGLHSVREIVRCVQNNNFALQKLELFATTGVVNASDVSDDPDLWPTQTGRDALTRCLERNAALTRMTESEALSLLRYSRSLLLAPGRLHSASGSIPPESRSSGPWNSVPIELKLEILYNLAPSLSSNQRIRIMTYAADPSTLPATNFLLSPGQTLPRRSDLRAAWLFKVGCNYYDVLGRI